MELPPPWAYEREIAVKCDARTDPAYGFEPSKRPLSELVRFGIVNLDKPSGPSSHEVVAWTKRILGVKRAGHGGTLEPVSGGDIPRSPAFFP